MLAVLWPGAAGPVGAAAGSVDQGFGAGGAVQTDLSLLDTGLDVLVQPDGKAITVGYADDEGVVLRHRVDGTLDPAFGVGGVVRSSPPAAFFQAGVLQADGRIVVVGSDAALDDMVVFRYLPSGAPDPSFGAGGAVATDLGGAAQAYAVALQPDGKLVVAGRSADEIALARYLPNGDLDPAFGTGGTTTTLGPAGNGGEASALGILSTGAVVVGGRVVTASGPSMFLARYTPGGFLDGSFGSGGWVADADTRLTNLTSLVVQPGDRVVVAGATGEGHAPVQSLARYSAGGSLDATFGTGGSASTPVGVASTTEDVAVDGAGRLLTVGAVRYSGDLDGSDGFGFVSVSRLSSDGAVDATFGCAGSTQVELASADGGRATGVALAPDGRILVGGVAFNDPDVNLGDPDFLLVRVLADAAAGAGYWVTRADGGVSPFGTAGGCGSLRGLPLAQPVVGHAARPSGDGYWFVAADGGVFTRGDAPFFGSAGGLPLNRPMVGMARTPSGNGYWLVADDGGVFAYGDAGFFGSTGALRLNQGIVGMAATPSGNGYWLVASDGGVFAFGAAGFFGSTGGVQLDRRVIGMARTASGSGYWLAGADGGIFSFGDAPFLGSTGDQPFTSPAVAIT